MLKEYEKDFAGTIAGGYSGIYNYEFRHIKQGVPRRNDGAFDILACDCGELDCWNFIAEINESDEFVTWSNFKQPRRDWDYSNFGPFMFKKDEYKKIISEIPTQN